MKEKNPQSHKHAAYHVGSLNMVLLHHFWTSHYRDQRPPQACSHKTGGRLYSVSAWCCGLGSSGYLYSVSAWCCKYSPGFSGCLYSVSVWCCFSFLKMSQHFHFCLCGRSDVFSPLARTLPFRLVHLDFPSPLTNLLTNCDNLLITSWSAPGFPVPCSQQR